MLKQPIFKLIVLIIVPLVVIELTLSFLFLFKDTLIPVFNRSVNMFFSPHKVNSMWTEYGEVNNFEHISHILHRRKPFKGKYINIGEDRNRVTINPVINDSSKLKKVWFFGGSTMWGTGSDNDSLTIPSIAIKMLNETDNKHDYFGVNYGESAFSSTIEFIQLIIALRNDKPDIIVFLDGVNDCMNSYNNGLVDAEPNYYTNKYILENKKDPDYSISKIIYILKRLQIIDSSRSKNYYKKDMGLEQDVAKVLTNNWKLVYDLCLINGIDYYTYLQPNAFVGDYGKKYSKKSEMSTFYRDVYDYVKSKNIGKSYFYDISNIMPIDFEYFYDKWCHTGSKGNRIIASNIVKYISLNE